MVMPRKVRDIALAVALLGIPFAFLQANLKDPDSINPIDKLLLRISAPIQAAVTAVASGVHRTWKRYVYLVGLQRENERLVGENMRLKRSVREAQRQLAKMGRYERLLTFRRERRVETTGARVIGRSSSPFIRALRIKIDRGQAEVRPGLAVVTSDGVVGRVARVFSGYSDVRLAVDPKSSIDVVIQRTGARGLLHGKDAQDRYLCRLSFLLRKEEVKVGDLIVTSGAADVFPRDLPVGRISRISRRTYGLYQEVEVTPTVDFGALEEVLVIVGAPPPKAPPVAGETAPARGITP